MSVHFVNGLATTSLSKATQRWQLFGAGCMLINSETANSQGAFDHAK